MPSELVFKGDFSFVNVDATSLSTLPHRQQVTRHVHGYRRWKKGQEARRLRESSKFHDGADRHSTTQQLAPKPAAGPPQPPDVSFSSGTIRSLPPLLDVILLNGNSDPFDALPEQMTATVNSLLSFERDCIFPSIKELELRMTEKENAFRETAFTATWIDETKAYLYDSIAIHSYLSRIATNRYMITSRPEFLDAAHQFRRKGVASLKQYMTSTSQIDVLRLYRALLILLFADSSLGDRDAFHQHLAVLKDVFESHHDVLFNDPSFNLHHFISVIYFEVQYAVMGLSKTSLDLSPRGWVEKQFMTLWQEVGPTFAFSRLRADQNLDPALDGDLRSLYLDAREILDIITQLRKHTLLNTSSTWFYAISKAILTIGRLVNLFVHLDIDSVLHNAEDVNMPASKIRGLEVASASLCAVYWLRELSGIENIPIDKMCLFTWNPTMLGKLRQILAAYDGVVGQTMPQQDATGNFRLSLWIVWTGAMAENATLAPATSTEEDQNWFRRQFCSLLRRANIESEVQCQAVLDSFLQLHGMRPSRGNRWDASCFPPHEER